MKISFDSALLWLIPYLYLVSITYYWGYWGTLHIDAFNYYEVSDFVKGITSPLSGTIYYVASICFTLGMIKNFFDGIKKTRPILFITLLLTLLALLLGIFIYGYYLIAKSETGQTTSFWASPIWVFIAGVIVSVRINEYLPPLNTINSAIRLACIVFITLLPIQAHSDGRSRALNILNNREFDYLAADSLGNSKSLYKFLGKAGNYYFLSTVNNEKQIITPTDKLAPLIIEHYLDTDSASIIRYRATSKSLITDSTNSN